MDIEFSGEVWEWRGPAPFHFVTVPPDESRDLHDMSTVLTYGWGMIPVTVTVGRTTWKTSLWPKDGDYVVPLKVAARRAEKIGVGDVVTVRLEPGG